jgi:hypothetical protein
VTWLCTCSREVFWRIQLIHVGSYILMEIYYEESEEREGVFDVCLTELVVEQIAHQPEKQR